MAQTVKLDEWFLFIGEEATVSDYAAEGVKAHTSQCLYQAYCGATENAAEAGIELSFDDAIDWAGQYLMDGTSSCYCD